MRRRPSGAYVLALDVGSSSVRALLYDSHGRAAPGAEVHLPYQPRIDREGAAEVDVDRLLRLAERAVDELLIAAGTRRAGWIAAVGVSTFWHGLLGADERARPLTPLYLWSDARGWRAAGELARRLDAEAVRQRTGCMIHPSYWPAKLAWLRAERPELWRRRTHWLSFPDLLYQRLFGRLATSVSMASGTGLLRLREQRWDEQLLEALEVAPESLPPLEARMHGLEPRHARRWPALANVEWVLAAGDGALANYGSGCVDPSRRALTVGTSGALRVITRERPRRLPRGIWCYRLDETRFVVGASFNNGGNLYAWLVETLAVDEKKLEGTLRRMPPCAHGLTFMPLLAGERSPGFAAHATGAIAGLTLATTAVDIVRAGLEAVAIEFARGDRLADEVEPEPERVVASGHGLLASPAWMQIMADALGRRVTASRAKEASSRGAALFALEALGLLEIEDVDPGATRVYEPRPAATRAYAEALKKQEALYKALITEEALQPGAAPAHLQVRTRMG